MSLNLWAAVVTVDGDPFTEGDLETVKQVVARIFGQPVHVEIDGAGGWLIELPAQAMVELTFSGGYMDWTHTDEADVEYKVEIELP